MKNNFKCESFEVQEYLIKRRKERIAKTFYITTSFDLFRTITFFQ